MHSKDREWRGLVWFGVSLPVIALVLTLAPVALLFPASTSHMLATFKWLSPQPYVAFLFLVALCLPFVLFALSMRNRERRRASNC